MSPQVLTMFRAITYKEWLKIRWTYAGIAILFVLILTKISLDLSYVMRFQRPVNVWYTVVFRQWLFYELLRFLPLIGGIALAAAQFVPEALQARLKLTLHLPVGENSALIQMLLFGLGMFTMLLVSALVALAILSGIHFPAEVAASALRTALPWFVAGLAAYCAVACIVIDHAWGRRAILLLIAAGLVQGYYESGMYEMYTRSLPWFVLLVFPFGFAVVLSAYRFRRGVR